LVHVNHWNVRKRSPRERTSFVFSIKNTVFTTQQHEICVGLSLSNCNGVPVIIGIRELIEWRQGLEITRDIRIGFTSICRLEHWVARIK